MGISQRQVQKLQQTLSPQQIQMIKLLELPAMQLEQRIKQEVEDNIVLEEDATPEEEQEKISVDDYIRGDDTPGYKSRVNNYSKDEKQRPMNISEGRSMQEYLTEQLGYRNLSDRDMRIASFLVGSIDSDGYLRRDLESISDDIAFSLGIETTVDELERLLGIIHQLEPAGIGARNLRECLLLQMDQRRMDTPAKRLARKILTSYFDEFVKKHYEKLMARLNVGEDEFREAIEEIRHLSPKPGNLYSEGGVDTTPYIVPDFKLDYHDGQFDLTLNSSNIPEVKINRRYVDMMRQMVAPDGTVPEKNREAVQFVKSKIDSAKWFISAIKQRHDTLMRTMQEILNFQKEYFRDGDKSKLRPMILKDTQVALLGGDADGERRDGVELRDKEHTSEVHRRGGQTASPDRRDADEHTQLQGILHSAAYGCQVPRDAGYTRGAIEKTDMTNKSAMRLSRVVSAVFHPCLLPIYAVITVLFSDTVYSFYTMRVKFYLIWVVVLYAAFIPMLAYFLFKRLDGLKRMSIDRSRLRMLMLMVGAVCYMLCAVTLLKLPSLLLFRKLATAAVMCEIFCIFTVRRWNVSLHLAAMGAVTALFVMLNIIGVMSLFWPMVAAIIVSGLLASSRLCLGRHDGWEVLAGFGGGFLISSLSLLYI